MSTYRAPLPETDSNTLSLYIPRDSSLVASTSAIQFSCILGYPKIYKNKTD